MKKSLIFITILLSSYCSCFATGGGKDYAYYIWQDLGNGSSVLQCCGTGHVKCPGVIILSNGGIEINRLDIDKIVIEKLKNREEVSTLIFPNFVVYVTKASLDENEDLDFTYTISLN